VPEGDTIHKLAASMRPWLTGATLNSVHLRDGPGADLLLGRPVDEVFAIGKHLMIRTGEVALRTHLGMTGAWHAYAPDERWWEPESKAGVVLEIDGRVVVCFDPRHAEVVRMDELARHPVLGVIGPDLCLDEVDFDEVLRRARLPDQVSREVADLLLDQRVAAGIGNVYKSELLFLHGVDPWSPSEAVPDDVVLAMYRDAHRLLRVNLQTGRRITARKFLRHARDKTPGAGLWVYDRARRPCRRCGAVVQVARIGGLARLIYWCPECQGRKEVPPTLSSAG